MAEATKRYDAALMQDRRAVAGVMLASHQFVDGSPLHDYYDGEFDREPGWTRMGDDGLATEVAPDGSEGKGCVLTVTFLPGTALVLRSAAIADGIEIGEPADPDSDVSGDDMHDGNDDHIEALRDRIGELRTALRDAMASRAPTEHGG